MCRRQSSLAVDRLSILDKLASFGQISLFIHPIVSLIHCVEKLVLVVIYLWTDLVKICARLEVGVRDLVSALCPAIASKLLQSLPGILVLPALIQCL